MAAVASGEVERLAERVAHGKAARQAKGGHHGKPPWAFIRAADGLGLTIDPKLSHIAKGFIDHFVKSAPMRDAVRWLWETHPIRKAKSSMTRWMKNPALAGDIGKSALLVHRPLLANLHSQNHEIAEVCFCTYLTTINHTARSQSHFEG